MWKEEDNTLKRSFEFKDFQQAFGFMAQAAIDIERMNHHPKWTNVYNNLEVELTTHDAGNKVTDKDRELAKRFDKIFEQYS